MLGRADALHLSTGMDEDGQRLSELCPGDAGRACALEECMAQSLWLLKMTTCSLWNLGLVTLSNLLLSKMNRLDRMDIFQSVGMFPNKGLLESPESKARELKFLCWHGTQNYLLSLGPLTNL